MKRGTIEHPKMKRLTRALGCEDLLAVGIMESLWHFASRYAPRGDIGRFSDEEIADAIKYKGDGAKLTAALTESGWVDACTTHRLVLHDWFEHADDAVHMTLARAIEKFASGEVPRLTRLSKPERERIEPQFRAHGKRTASARRAHGVRTASAQPSHPPPSPAIPLQEEEKIGGPEISVEPASPDLRADRNTDPEPVSIARLVFVGGRTVDQSAPWLDEPAAIWRERYGGEVNRHELLRHLSGPRESVGHAELMVRWRNYVTDTDARYQPGPEKFAPVHGDYTAENHKRRMEVRSGRTRPDGDGNRPGGGKRTPTSSTHGGDKYASSRELNARRNRNGDPSGAGGNPILATGT